MKRKLLTTAFAALIGVGSMLADTWSIIGAFGNWENDVDMQEVSAGVFSVEMESLQGEFKFRANHSWDVNFGAAFAFDVTGNADDIEVVQDGRNFNASEELKNVRFTIDVEAATLSISGLPNDMELTPPEITEVYLIGEPAGEWSTSVGVKMKNIDNVKYTWKGNLTEGQYFGFATELNDESDWDALNAHRFGPASDGEPLQESNPVYFPHEGAWYVATTGVYKLTLDTENLILTAELTEPDKWGLIGDFNNWADDIEMQEVSSGVYSVEMESLQGEFKFRANADWEENLGAAS